jgi:DtxR family transcriptional regulator, Mn-dependent transcriptional regulator
MLVDAEEGDSILSPSLEDYLEEIFRYSLAKGNVRVSDISNKLQVSLPSVTRALQKLRDLEYILYERYGEILLTDKGKQLGSFLVQRNQLLQEFLAMLSCTCDIEAEAEAMEHYLSDSTILSIQLLVAFMKAKPNYYQEFLSFVQTMQPDT